MGDAATERRGVFIRASILLILLAVVVVDLGVTYALSSYASDVCGIRQSDVDRAMRLQLLASTLFLCVAAAFVVRLEWSSRRRNTWLISAIGFVVVETLLKIVANWYPQFLGC